MFFNIFTIIGVKYTTNYLEITFKEWTNGTELSKEAETGLRTKELSTIAAAPKQKPPHLSTRGFSHKKPDDDLLSHWLQHYHRRKVVSRSCSGWEGVVPTRYGHQA